MSIPTRTGVRFLPIACTVAAGLLLLLTGAHSASAQEVLYGTQGQNLVSINPANVSQVTTIGNMGLGSNFAVFALAYHPGQNALFGLASSTSGAPAEELVRIDQGTGQATVVTTLDLASSPASYEGFEYVASLGSLVITTGTTGTSRLNLLSPTGAITFRTNISAFDNDYAVYDSRRDLFYTIDQNDVGQLVQVNTTTGATSNHGSITGLADAAYSVLSDAVYAVGVQGASGTPTGHLLRFNAALGTSSINGAVVDLGTVGGGSLGSVAFISPAIPATVPEPGSLALLGLAFPLGLLPLRRRLRYSGIR